MKIKSCRSCNSKSLIKLYSLGKQSLTGIFPPSKKTKITKGNLSMIICNVCKLLQLENNFNPYEMYGDNYGYMSSLNRSMVSHLNIKSLNLKKRYKFKPKDSILDIGSNDGTFLSFFSKNLIYLDVILLSKNLRNIIEKI